MVPTAVIGMAVAASIGVGPGHDYDSQLILLTPTPNLPLLEAAPYPARRVDDPSRAELGRVFHGRTPAERIRASVLDLDGAERYGAALGDLDTLIHVRTRRPLPDIAISPWQDIDERTFQDIRRRRPWVRFEDADGILQDLRTAQRRWLEQHGFVGGVRTHVSPATLRAASGKGAAEKREPSAIIRFRDPEPRVPDEQRVSLPRWDDATLVSTPASPAARVLAQRDAD
jgi:hypothetical protein